MRPTDRTVWQKSSYSSAGNNCLELARVAADQIALRESDDPGIILSTSRTRLAALLKLARQHEPR
ncbi:DUF397 domain-containing protein [Streptomyces sp. 7-21]|jgi:hypothetical protein|uniref:DUF397 domain-containing protein n=1 Tax=Streptomyces sp. 7-21 TaxID=2802283 RepID=UPI0027DE2AE8|nr:DUF397 domain-containing protein [Streptomyces sp. 7-21]